MFARALPRGVPGVRTQAKDADEEFDDECHQEERVDRPEKVLEGL